MYFISFLAYRIFHCPLVAISFPAYCIFHSSLVAISFLPTIFFILPRGLFHSYPLYFSFLLGDYFISTRHIFHSSLGITSFLPTVFFIPSWGLFHSLPAAFFIPSWVLFHSLPTALSWLMVLPFELNTVKLRHTPWGAIEFLLSMYLYLLTYLLLSLLYESLTTTK